MTPSGVVQDRAAQSGDFKTPDILNDDLTGVTINEAGVFVRDGKPIGLVTAYRANVPSGIQVIEDPTRAGRYVVRLDYAKVLDLNFNLASPKTAGFGTEWCARGYFYCENPDWNEHGGKIEQLLGSGSGGIQAVFYFMATANANSPVGVQIVLNNGKVHYEQAIGPTIASRQWHYYERRIKMNSAFGVKDGEFTLWLDDATKPVLDLSDVPWYAADNGKTLDVSLAFGTQYNGTAPASRPRYWRNIAASTTQIGPAASVALSDATDRTDGQLEMTVQIDGGPDGIVSHVIIYDGGVRQFLSRAGDAVDASGGGRAFVVKGAA